MSELTAKENIKTADTVKRITATAVMAALTTLMTAYIFHIPVGDVYKRQSLHLPKMQRICRCRNL